MGVVNIGLENYEEGSEEKCSDDDDDEEDWEQYDDVE